MPEQTFTYTALVHDDGRIEYAEHYEAEKDARDRARQLEDEATIRGEASGKWRVYLGNIPYEAVKAQADYLLAHPIAVDATQEERDEIMEYSVLAGAEAVSVSVLTAPPVDDRPEWYKAGSPSQEAYERELEERARQEQGEAPSA